jgi:membrane fusion protein (multidrug efflux system)
MTPHVKRSLKAGVFILAILGTCIMLWKPWAADTSKAASSPSSGREPSSSSAMKVEGVAVQPKAFVETIIASGTLRAEESIELQTEVTGKVAGLFFTDGEAVQQDAVLVKIDDSTLQANLKRSEARRALASLRERRLAEIVDQGAVSRLDYDESLAEISILDAEIELIRAEIRRTEIRAPFDGIVGVRFVSIGAYVNPATRIATLQGIDVLKLDFSIPERYAAMIKIGDPLQFSLASGDVTFTATVSAVEPRIDIVTRSVLVRAVCANIDGTLLPGAFARVEFTVARNESALLVPSLSVISGLEERTVYVAVDGLAQRRLVTTGARTTTHIQILEGLKAGEVVITSGIQQLRNGASISVNLLP